MGAGRVEEDIDRTKSFSKSGWKEITRSPSVSCLPSGISLVTIGRE